MKNNIKFLEFLLSIMLILTISTAFDTANVEYYDDSDFQVIVHRLPNNTIPIHYNIRLTLHLEEDNFTFYGESEVKIKIRRVSSQISLHSRKLEIDEVATILVNNVNKTAYKPLQHTYNNETNILRLDFDHALSPGFYTLHMKFAGNIPEFHGLKLGFMRYPYSNGHSSWIFATHFQPDGARQMFPCWDEPALKATFDISLLHDNKYRTFSNMPIREIFLEPNDTVLIQFDTTPIMSTYLVAIVAFFQSDYITLIGENVKYGDNNMLCRSYLTSQVTFAHNIAKQVLPFFNQYTNISEKVPKMDHVLVPDYPVGGMEHWGLIIYKESSVFYDNNIHSIDQKKQAALIIAHELVHQWFGNLVTPSWWDYLWLSEGFASFFENYILDKIFKDWRIMELFVVEILHYCFILDIGILNSVTLKLEYGLELGLLFSTEVYKKAPVLLRMLHNVITDEVFQKGLITYLAVHQFNSTTPDDLWNAMQSALDESDISNKNYSIKEVMDTWMNQERYPLVTVMRNYETGEVTLSQKCFRAREMDECINNTWWIPVTFATQSNPDFSNTVPRYWLRPNQNLSFNIDPNDWIVLNVQQIGYYRVNYDLRNWDKLSHYLTDEDYTNIHVLNRAQIIRDSYTSVMEESKEMNGVLFIKLINYLARETDYIAWHPMFLIIGWLTKLFVFPETENVKVRIIDLLDRLIQNVGYEENPDDDDITQQKRLDVLKWACTLGHEGCKRAATIKLSEHLANPDTHTIPEWWEEFTYCFGLKAANRTTWDKMLEMLHHKMIHRKRSTDHNHNHNNNNILLYLSCVEDPEILINYLNNTVLNMSLFSETEHSFVIRFILEKHASNNLIFDYILENFDILKPRSLTPFVLIKLILLNVYTNEQIDKIKSFSEKKFDEDLETINKIHRQVETQKNFIKNSVDIFKRRFYSTHPL